MLTPAGEGAMTAPCFDVADDRALDNEAQAIHR
jgi:hypothetical protein